MGDVTVALEHTLVMPLSTGAQVWAILKYESFDTVEH